MGGRAQKDGQSRGQAVPGRGSLAASRPPLTSRGWASPGSAALFLTNFVEVLVSLHCGEGDFGPLKSFARCIANFRPVLTQGRTREREINECSLWQFCWKISRCLSPIPRLSGSNFRSEMCSLG